MKHTVLIIDDEEGIREALSEIFKDESFNVIAVSSGEEGLNAFKKQLPDVVYLDIWLPGIDGLETLEEMKNIDHYIPVIIISGHGKIDQAVKATKMGAYDFLEKPLSLERVLLTAQRAIERRELQLQNEMLRKDMSKRYLIVGKSMVISVLKDQIKTAAKSNSRVLIMGESGVGKELVARNLHLLSSRAEKPFIEVNCAAIPNDLIESELFGHEKGSFTGAYENKKGKFELADKGTLFLDEIGDMSMKTQTKVLRTIETQEFQRVGSSKSMKINTRIISATNKNLKKEVEEGRFREDLYFRLNVIPIVVPPLRERKNDIHVLIDHFMKLISAEYGKPVKHITSDAINKLKNHSWPGNVRELRNTVERFFIMRQADVITHKDISIYEGSVIDYTAVETLKDARELFEKEYIIKRLNDYSWNVVKTAEALQIERGNLYKKMRVLGIEVQ